MDKQELEILRKAGQVVIDKTGTLTDGRPEVKAAACFDSKKDDKEECDRMIAMVAALERHSNHPLALAAVKYGGKMAGESEKFKSYFRQLDVTNVREIVGKGMSGVINGIEVLVGRPRWIADRGFDVGRVEKEIEELEKLGQTVVLVVIGRIVGMIGMRDKLKLNSKEVVAKLKKIGMKVWMITGDNQRTAEAVAMEAGIDKERVMGGVMPEDKGRQIEIIQRAGGQVVVMVGDKSNDAEALAQADLGVTMEELLELVGRTNVR